MYTGIVVLQIITILLPMLNRQSYFNDDLSDYKYECDLDPGFINPYRLYKAERRLYGGTPPKQIKQENTNTIRLRKGQNEMKKQFAKLNHEMIEFSEKILKETVPKQFYPLTKNRHERNTTAIDLKNENQVQMESNKNIQDYVDLTMKVKYRTGLVSIELKSQIFQQYKLEKASVQFQKNQNQFPNTLFFCFDAALSKQDLLRSISNQGNDDVPSNNNPKIRMEKEVKKLSFQQIAHTILGRQNLPAYAWRQENIEKSDLQKEVLDAWQQKNSRTNLEFITSEEVYYQCPENIYISSIQDLHQLKNEVAITSKRFELNCENAEIAMDIRAILQSQKIYFIQMMEETAAAIKLAQTAESRIKEISISVIKQIYQILINKSKQFLLLACTFVPSSIEIDVRVRNLFEYLTSNFMYSDTLATPSAEILRTSHVLDSWYNIPNNSQLSDLSGYGINEVKERIYELIRKSCVMKRQIEYNAQEVEIRKIIEQTGRYELAKAKQPTKPAITSAIKPLRKKQNSPLKTAKKKPEPIKTPRKIFK